MPAPLQQEQYSINARCPKCRATGSVVWERLGAAKSLVSVSSSFYERIAKFTPYKIEVVCQRCGTVIPDLPVPCQAGQHGPASKQDVE